MTVITQIIKVTHSGLSSVCARSQLQYLFVELRAVFPFFISQVPKSVYQSLPARPSVARVAMQVGIVALQPVVSFFVIWLIATATSIAISLAHAMPIGIAVVAGRVAILPGIGAAPTASPTLGLVASRDTVRQVETSPRWVDTSSEVFARWYPVAVARVLLVTHLAFCFLLVLPGLLAKLALGNAVLNSSSLLRVLHICPIHVVATRLGFL